MCACFRLSCLPRESEAPGHDRRHGNRFQHLFVNLSAGSGRKPAGDLIKLRVATNLPFPFNIRASSMPAVCKHKLSYQVLFL